MARRSTLRWALAGFLTAAVVVGVAIHRALSFDDGGALLRALCEANPPGSRFDYEQWYRRTREAGLTTTESRESADDGATTSEARGRGAPKGWPSCSLRVRAKTVLGYEAWSRPDGQLHHSVAP